MKNDVVIIQLDRPRQLKFGHTALKTLVELTGKSIEELDNNLDVSDFELLEKLVYCGLLKDAKDFGETLKLEQLPEMLDQSPSFAHTIEKVVAAWRIAFGAPATEGNQQPVEEPANKKNTTGKKASA